MGCVDYYEYIASEEWRSKADATKARDGHCLLCGSTHHLDAHHLTYAHLGDERPDELVTLCRRCHELVHENGLHESLSGLIGKLTNKDDAARATKGWGAMYDRFGWAVAGMDFALRSMEADVTNGGTENVADSGNLNRMLRSYKWPENPMGANPGAMMSGDVFISHIDRRIEALWLRGMKPAAIAKKMRIPVERVCRRLKKKGYDVKAKNWVAIEASEGGFKKLAPGFYVCRIVAVSDVADKEYLNVVYDIAEGPDAGYYSDKWGVEHPNSHRMCASYKDSAEGMFKGFLNALEASNMRFSVADWQMRNNEQEMVGLTLGLAIQTRYYTDEQGEDRATVEARYAIPADKVRQGKAGKLPDPRDQRVDKTRPLPGTAEATQAATAPTGEVYADIPFI